MSKENVKKFYQAVATDESLRVRLSELNKKYEGEAPNEEKKAALVEKLVLPIAAEMGLAFSMEDLLKYEEEMRQGSSDDELNIEELGAVSGGTGFGVGYCVVVGGGVGIALGICFIIGI